MFKSQFESTDIYFDQSDNQHQIIFKIETTQQKWAHFFLNAEGSDLKIKHKQLLYPAHRNIIFKNIGRHALELQTEKGYLQLPQNLNPELVQGVLSCLYSLQLKISRAQALEILDIVHCLHIGKLKRQIQEDIKVNIQEYEIFPLLQKSINFDMEEIKDLCLDALQSQYYQQVRYGKFDLLNCNEQTVKFVVHHHNQRKWQQPTFGLNEKYFQQIVLQYCKHNNYSQKQKNKLIKQLGDMSLKTQFPSFSKIKLKTLENDFQKESPLYTPRAFVKETSFNFKSLTEPQLQPDCSSTKSMIVDLTYMDRRRKSSRGSESNNSQSKIFSDLISLKEKNKQMENEMEQLNENIQQIQKTIIQKDLQHRNMTFKVAEVESLLQESEKELMQQNKQLLLLDIKISKIIMSQINQSGAFDEQLENIRSSNSLAQSEQGRTIEKQQKKGQNQKDLNLRVSLIQSKWVCC